MTFRETHLLMQAVRYLCAISRERLSVERPQRKVEVSILFYPEWPAVFLHLPVGRTIRQNNRQPRMELGVATAYRTDCHPPWLARIVNWDGESQDIGRVITVAFGAEDYLDCIGNLEARGVEPLWYINNLDKVRILPILR